MFKRSQGAAMVDQTGKAVCSGDVFPQRRMMAYNLSPDRDLWGTRASLINPSEKIHAALV